MQKKQVGLVWFRNDLRVADNASLANAGKENEKVIAVYCFDPRQFEQSKYGNFKKTEKFRTKFNIESVRELKTNLEKLNISLFVYNQNPEDVIPNLISEFDVKNVYCQEEWTKDEVKIENEIKSKIDNSIEFKTVYDQFLFHPKDIPFDVKDIPSVFTQFRNKCEKASKIRTESVATVMASANLEIGRASCRERVLMPV